MNIPNGNRFELIRDRLYRRACRPERALLVFNPSSGRPDEAGNSLVRILEEMQRWRFKTEVFLLQPDVDLSSVVMRAIANGCRKIIAAGGDGTVDNLATAMAGKPAVLGILPTGTRNNIAFSLKIPIGNLAAAVRLLRRGRRISIDLGQVSCGSQNRTFLEAVALGLVSAVYPAADEIQHGNWSRLADLLSALVLAPPALVQVRIDNREILSGQAHMALITNMPYVGARFRCGADGAFLDGLLDVQLFNNLNKLDLVAYAVQAAAGGEDVRIQRFQARQVEIWTDPPVPIVADGIPLAQGHVCVSILPKALRVMSGKELQSPLALRLHQSTRNLWFRRETRE